MISGLAHVAVCVSDCEAAVAWYESVLGLTVLSPPYLMTGQAITDDMAELLGGRPVEVKASLVGFADEACVFQQRRDPFDAKRWTATTPAAGDVMVHRGERRHVFE